MIFLFCLPDMCFIVFIFRQEYEAAVNKITLTINHEKYFVYDSLLRAEKGSEETQHWTIETDRRKSLSSLREEIKKVHFEKYFN